MGSNQSCPLLQDKFWARLCYCVVHYFLDFGNLLRLPIKYFKNLGRKIKNFSRQKPPKTVARQIPIFRTHTSLNQIELHLLIEIITKNKNVELFFVESI